MSFPEFWLSVRTAAKFLAPQVTVDSPRLNRTALERGLQGAAIWLTPKSVEGFDEQDLDFLPPPERKELARSVKEFRDLAAKLAPNAPASADQMRRVAPLFLRILELLEFDRFGDAEAFQIGKRLEAELRDRLPPWVRELRFDTGPDAAGDPAIWIWVFLDDAAAEGEVLAVNAAQVRELLAAALGALRVSRWPYVRFRTVSEQPAAHEVGRA